MNRRAVASIVFIIIGIGAPSGYFAYQHHQQIIQERAILQVRVDAWEQLNQDLQKEIGQFNGKVGLVVRDLTLGWDIVNLPGESIAAASIVKIPLMTAVFKSVEEQVLSLDEKITLKEGDKVGGSGVLRYEKAGTSYSIEKLIELMISKSDNTATNLLIEHLGFDALNQYFASIGLEHTRLNRHMMDFDARSRGIENQTTAIEVALVLEKLYRNELTGPVSADTAFAYLKEQKYNDRIPALLPEGTVVAHKTGLERQVCHDAGIIFTDKGDLLITVLTQHKGAVRPVKAFIGRLSRLAYDYMIGT